MQMPGTSPRLLLVGQAIAPGEKSGLAIALADLAEQLTLHGWIVECAAYGPRHGTSMERLTLRPTNTPSRIAGLSRWRWAGWFGQKLPSQVRAFVEIASMPHVFWVNASMNLSRLEGLLQDATYDVILLAPTLIDAPGLMALCTTTHSRVVLIGLDAVSTELRAWWWSWLRGFLQAKFGQQLHPCLLRQGQPGRLAAGAFANRHWYTQAIRAGFPADRARIIPFGVPLPKPLPRRRGSHPRLLWVGRLSREKGLHLLLDALPIVLREVGHLSVTGIAAQGPAGYRRQILAMIRHLGLEDVVTLHPAVQRTQLRAAYAEHDLLFFHSSNTDPVALVLMEAFAAGLPVVSSQASPQAHLVQEGSTCLCYRSGDKRSLARAIIRLFTDFDLQTELTKKAGQCVQARFSLQAMGGEFDALLRSLL